MDIAAKTAKAMKSAKMGPFVSMVSASLDVGPTKTVPMVTNAAVEFVFHYLTPVRTVFSAIARNLA